MHAIICYSLKFVYSMFIRSVPRFSSVIIIWGLLFGDTCAAGNRHFNQNFNIRRWCN